jgi:hypothetical protein
LETNEGNPSIFSIYDISSYPIGVNEERIMSFKLGSQIFDVTINIMETDSIMALGPVSSIYSFPAFPVITPQGTNFFSKIGDVWANNFGIDIPFHDINAQPLISGDYDNDSNEEILFVSNKTLTIISADNSSTNPPFTVNYPDTIVDAPLYINSLSKIAVATQKSIFVGDDLETCIALPIPSAKLAFDGVSIIAVSKNYLYSINPFQPNENDKIELPENISSYLPVKDANAMAREWAEFQEVTATWNRPGVFVAFPGYEWHGIGRWGDHNVVCRTEGASIHTVQTLPELYECLRGSETMRHVLCN